ncbi:hypothetical protein ACFOEK_12220 [Litoribrevibacter euphylliae]|uniref:Uncharacterized protein n=1 Tax=Litoribrevibacter euphylliae TaxID=1834034 RepID=A0ABV7HJV0_9GAMM
MQARQLTWSDAVAQKLAIAMGDDQALFEREVQAGISHVWELLGGDLLMICRAEGDELVVCCLQGKNVTEGGPLIIENARRCGFKSVRFHTKHDKLGELGKTLGFKKVETIYGLEL